MFGCDRTAVIDLTATFQTDADNGQQGIWADAVDICSVESRGDRGVSARIEPFG